MQIYLNLSVNAGGFFYLCGLNAGEAAFRPVGCFKFIDTKQFNSMNLRDVKKDIEYFIGEFIDDCSLFVALKPGKNSDEVSAIIDGAVDLYNSLKDKINHPAEGPKKGYYDNIRREMLEKLDELSEKLSAVISK